MSDNVNKRDAVRALYAANNSITAQEVVDKMAAKGVEMDKQYASNCLSTARKEGGTSKAKSVAKKTAPATSKVGKVKKKKKSTRTPDAASTVKLAKETVVSTGAPRKKKKKRPVVAGSVPSNPTSASSSPESKYSVQDITRASALIKRSGGLSAAKALLDAVGS